MWGAKRTGDGAAMTGLSENPAERAERYIVVLEEALQKLNLLKEGTTIHADKIAYVSDTIHRYVRDARFYLDNGKPVTALASVAYAEGMLDAIKFLELTSS